MWGTVSPLWVVMVESEAEMRRMTCSSGNCQAARTIPRQGGNQGLIGRDRTTHGDPDLKDRNEKLKE